MLGYDIVNDVSAHFNPPDPSPFVWLRRQHGDNYGCQGQLFQLGDEFRTNNSVFKYSVDDIASSGGAKGSFLYSENSLADCDVSKMQVTVLPGDRMITVEVRLLVAHMVFRLNGPRQGSVACPELGFEASTSYAYANHALTGEVSPSNFPQNTLARAVADQLFTFGGVSKLFSRSFDCIHLY